MRWPQRVLPLTVTLVSIACTSAPPATRVPAAAPTPEVAPPPAARAGAQVTQAAPASGSRAVVPVAPVTNPESRNVRLTADGRMIEPARPGTPLDFPRVDGPLEVKVVYPRPGQVISVRDSTFLLGSVGSADAQLTVNGASVPVNPNGSFLAWLPVAPRENPRYELVATKNGASARASLEIAHPALPMPLPDTGRLVVDRASAQPAAANGKLRLRGDERVRVSIRAPGNATAAIHFADGTSRALANGAGTSWAAELPARLLERAARIVVVRGPDSVAVPIAPVAVVDPEAPRFVELLNSNEDATSDTDAVTILRPTAAGTYKWFVHPRTIVETTGERGDWVRVRLDASLEAWLEAKYVRAAERTVPVRRTLSNARVTAAERWSDVRIPLTERTPFLVEERRDALVVTLYDAVSNLDIINFPTNDPVVRDVSWEQVASDRVRVTVHLRQAPYGYLTLWERGAFVLRVRKPPLIGDAARPLEGRVIAVDAGHPPIGSTGPTGLYEGDATLAVAQALQPMLEAAGATVVMTRVAPGAVALGDRPIIARRADADVLVSIHLNAHPDGVNPYRTNGSGTYFFHDRAEPLARAVQRGMVRWMGLRDLGVNYDNLALARPTWMPAILCEGAFVIVPDQEAALRTAEFQSRYAIGILEGLEAYFRELGHSR